MVKRLNVALEKFIPLLRILPSPPAPACAKPKLRFGEGRLSRSGFGKDLGRFAGGPSRFRPKTAVPRFPSGRTDQVLLKASAIRAFRAWGIPEKISSPSAGLNKTTLGPDCSGKTHFSLPNKISITSLAERPSPRAELDSRILEILRGGAGKPAARLGRERRKGLPATTRVDFLRGIRLRPGRRVSGQMVDKHPRKEMDFSLPRLREES